MWESLILGWLVDSEIYNQLIKQTNNKWCNVYYENRIELYIIVLKLRNLCK